jgi:hypothetical protein
MIIIETKNENINITNLKEIASSIYIKCKESYKS